MRAPSPVDAVLGPLGRVADELRATGLTVPPLEGKLLRPLVAVASVEPAARDRLDDAFWSGALAVQMVHEASLLHDDVVDGAERRRGEPTVVAEEGVAEALVRGDLFLTGAYRVACRTGSSTFQHLFAEAVERTVAGEARQGASVGEFLALDRYREITGAKSGELFGIVAALPACLGGDDPGYARSTGIRIGTVYQMVDDLLDYCPGAARGKEPFRDYAQRKWTWILGEAGIDRWDVSRHALLESLFGDEEVAVRLLARLAEEADAALRAHRTVSPDDRILPTIFGDWLETASAAVEEAAREASMQLHPALPPTAPSSEASVAEAARAVGGPDRWPSYFGRHARTFRFASWLLPREARDRVAEVYAWCRFTDDLADGDPDTVSVPERRRRLAVWREMSREAWHGAASGIPLVDAPMERMAGRGIPFAYADDLVEGVGSDLGPVRIETDEELERYAYRVASVVGGWVTRLFGIDDPGVLSRAYELGHAMQLTNILRDVGEDWRADRIYLPRARLRTSGLDEEGIRTMVEEGAPITAAYVDLVESMMAAADVLYDGALEAAPRLPSWYGRPVVVAARCYQGIHDEIRRNGHDNLRRRAYTSLPRKLVLGLRGLRELRRLGDLPGSLRPGSVHAGRPAHADG